MALPVILREAEDQKDIGFVLTGNTPAEQDSLFGLVRSVLDMPGYRLNCYNGNYSRIDHFSDGLFAAVVKDKDLSQESSYNVLRPDSRVWLCNPTAGRWNAALSDLWRRSTRWHLLNRVEPLPDGEVESIDSEFSDYETSAVIRNRRRISFKTSDRSIADMAYSAFYSEANDVLLTLSSYPAGDNKGFPVYLHMDKRSLVEKSASHILALPVSLAAAAWNTFKQGSSHDRYLI